MTTKTLTIFPLKIRAMCVINTYRGLVFPFKFAFLKGGSGSCTKNLKTFTFLIYHSIRLLHLLATWNKGQFKLCY